MTPLHVAAERAHNDILEVLQKHGAKVLAQTRFLTRPLVTVIQPQMDENIDRCSVSVKYITNDGHYKPNSNSSPRSIIKILLPEPVLRALSLPALPGQRGGHAGADLPPPGGAGRPHPDLQAAAELRGRPQHRVPAGLHCCPDGQRGGTADPQR